ncbi:MAG: methyltransferase domain-containing protein [Chloroflexaceae bacterium]|nr:methyltransferase domain-containing protein [Chloroflexaceae bacterium]
MYSITNYGQMIADTARTDAYVAALSQQVKPGSVVVDIGTGTGIFALIACQLGARQVYAIEPSDAIQVAREIAAHNGYQGRIHFHQALSTAVELPEPADVIVSDLRGVLPLFGDHIAAIADARRRFLAPGGQLIPCQDRIWVALVEDSSLYARHDGPWPNRPYGIDMTPGRSRTINTSSKGKVAAEQLVGEPQLWATLDYTTISEPNWSNTLSWTLEQPRTGHGLLVWFDATLGPGIGYSNSPLAADLVYGRSFFPWQQEVALASGDRVAVTLQASLVGEDYLWRWETEITSGDRLLKAQFRQSTFFGQPLSMTALSKRSEVYQPQLTEVGQIDAWLLVQMGQPQTLKAIAEKLHQQFPQRFPSYKKAFNYVADLSQRYG